MYAHSYALINCELCLWQRAIAACLRYLFIFPWWYHSRHEREEMPPLPPLHAGPREHDTRPPPCPFVYDVVFDREILRHGSQSVRDSIWINFQCFVQLKNYKNVRVIRRRIISGLEFEKMWIASIVLKKTTIIKLKQYTVKKITCCYVICLIHKYYTLFKSWMAKVTTSVSTFF